MGRPKGSKNKVTKTTAKTRKTRINGRRTTLHGYTLTDAYIDGFKHGLKEARISPGLLDTTQHS